MNKLPLIALSLGLAFAVAVAAQNQNANTNSNRKTVNRNASANKNRGPIFRANAGQIRQAQAILKQRNFYRGEETGKLDKDTRAGLQKYQEAEGLKVTGTLNKLTLQKMGIALTDKQRAM